MNHEKRRIFVHAIEAIEAKAPERPKEYTGLLTYTGELGVCHTTPYSGDAKVSRETVMSLYQETELLPVPVATPATTIRPISKQPSKYEHKTKRGVGARLQFQVFKRDKYRCIACGRSPAKNLEIELHVDHIIPWSIGGDTVIENLQTLCSVCNLGKGNLNS